MSKKDDNDKRLRFRLEGSIPITDQLTLNTAMAHVRYLREEARKLGDAKVSVSVPRLTNLLDEA